MQFHSSATVRDVSFEGVQSGSLLQGVLELKLENASEDTLEVNVRCRSLPGSLAKFTAVFSSGIHVESVVREKKDAEAVYENAISETRSAVLLEIPDEHSFSLSLGAWSPNSTCILRVRKFPLIVFC